jgi:drug/metabolite transporter (DMT)-like permease
VTRPPATPLADLALVLVAFLWGFSFVVVKSALDDVSTLLFLALRFSLATLVLFAFFRLRGFAWRGEKRMWQGGAFCGFLLFAGYALQTAGLRTTSASKSAFLTGLYIILVPLLSSLVYRYVPGPAEWLGVLAAAAGTALLSLAPSQGWRLSGGDLLTIGCAFAFAAHILAVENWSRRMRHELLSLWQLAGVAVFSLSTFAWLETPRVVWSGKLWSALLLTAVLATAVSFALYTWAQKHTTATRAALIFALEPVFAGLAGWMLAGESWTARSLGGAALILGGIVLAGLKPWSRAGHPVA